MKKLYLLYFVSTIALAFSAEGPSVSPLSQLNQENVKLNVQEGEDWIKSVNKNTPKKLGCFHAKHPDTAPKEIECAVPSEKPRPIGLQKKPSAAITENADVGGGRNGYMIQTRVGTINTAWGRFDTVSGVERNQNYQYTLQLNTNAYGSTQACNGGQPECRVWQQYVYDSSSYSTPQLYVQYWLISYGNSCPSGWWSASDLGGSCYKNSDSISVPYIDVADLAEDTANFVGATITASTYYIDLYYNGNNYVVSLDPTVLDIGSVWTSFGFNIYGDGGGKQVDFNPGTYMKIDMILEPNDKIDLNAVPICIMDNTTGETNNLNLGGDCYISDIDTKDNYMYFSFTQSN